MHPPQRRPRTLPRADQPVAAPRRGTVDSSPKSENRPDRRRRTHGGGHARDNGDGGRPKADTDDDSTGWDAALGYSSGPVHLAVSYLHAEVGTGSDGDDELDVVVVGATYVLGGGAKVYAEVFWMDAESAVSTNTNNEGYGFLIGTAVKF